MTYASPPLSVLARKRFVLRNAEKTTVRKRAAHLGHRAGGMALKSAHQVVRTSCSPALRRYARGPHPPEKILMASCRASLRLPFPRPLGKSGALPARTADRHCSRARLANLGRVCTPQHVARCEKTLLTLVTLREAHSFRGSGLA
jgi:hypothetical protein